MSNPTDNAVAVVELCPGCNKRPNIGRHKETKSLILHCPRCNVRFPDAAPTKTLVDSNVVAGWNVYAALQAKLSAGVELKPSDVVAEMKKVRDLMRPLKPQQH